MSETFYNEIINEHNLRPYHKHSIEGANFTLEGVNPSCGDDIILNLVVDDDGIITDGAYEGEGCAISQASADIMLDLVIGKSKEEALRLADIFMRMIKEGITDEEKDELEEAGILESVSHMPARVKCAVLGWRTITELFTEAEE